MSSAMMDLSDSSVLEWSVNSHCRVPSVAMSSQSALTRSPRRACCRARGASGRLRSGSE